MIKRILPMILCLVLMFGISASATNTIDSTSTDASAATEEMPVPGGRQGGGRGGMGTAPQGMTQGEMPPPMPDGGMPPMPEGENANPMPKGEFGVMGGTMQDDTQNIETTDAEVTSGIVGFVKTYSTPIIAVILLVFAFIFVIFYKRKSY